MKRFIVIAVILAVLGGIGYLSFSRINEQKNRKGMETGKDIQARLGIPVETTTIGMGSIESHLAINGSLKGRNEVPIYPKATGRIKQFYVDNGSRVRSGQVVAQLETSEIDEQVRQAEAAVAQARQNVIMVKNGARPQEKLQAENLTQQAAQAYEIAKTNLARMQNLLEKGVISQSQFDTYKLQYDQAKTSFENAKEQLALVNIGARDEQKSMAAEGLKQAEAALAYAKLMRENATVTSPVSGIVTSRIIDPGTLASPGMREALMTIVDDSVFYLESEISEMDLAKVKQRQEVLITVDAVPGRKFVGHVDEINPSVSLASRTYSLKIRVNRDKALTTGMFCRGDIITAARNNAVIAPKDAIHKDSEGYYVIVIGSDGKNAIAKRRHVELGLINTKSAEIISGLKTGEKIVTTGSSTLQDGDRINLTK